MPLHHRGAEDAVDHASNRRAGDRDQPLGLQPGDTVQQQAHAVGDRLAIDVEEESDEQRQQEHQHAVGDAEQQAEAVLDDDAEIGPQRLQHHADVGGPAVPQIAHGVADQRDVEHPQRRVRQAGAQPVHDDVPQMGHVVGAARRGDARSAAPGRRRSAAPSATRPRRAAGADAAAASRTPARW